MKKIAFRKGAIDRKFIDETSGNSQQSETPIAYQVGQFCHLLGISRTTFYELLKSGKIKAMKLGGRTLIPRAEAERLARGEVR
ncbi:MAG: helix-turn-helix domain-containing protein [Hyphomicrobiales bacterium]|nr:helix-turn-helix domain-containing protein [Hyphomicrobiales bacterium]